jgi:hypothetical protein
VTGAIFDFGTVALETAPTAGEVADGDMYLIAALTPSLDAGADTENLIPSDMWSEHYDLFRAGVLSGMMTQPAKPWTNVQLATFYGRDFSNRLGTARHKMNTGGIPGAQRWRFPRWA